MQFIPFCLFTIICGYSLVISAPVNQTNTDSPETKQQKATAIAGRLLKELASEQLAPLRQHSVSSNQENGATLESVEHPETSTMESDEEEQNSAEEDTELTPSADDLYKIYSDKYAQFVDDEESSSSEMNDDDYLFPINRQQLMNYLTEQEESDEHLTPLIHTPIMDNSIMTAEDQHHEQQRRRRRRSVY